MKFEELSYNDWITYYNGAIFKNPMTGNPCVFNKAIPQGYDEGIAAPKGAPVSRIVVTDVVMDPDGNIRRTQVNFDKTQIREYLSDTRVFETPVLGYRVSSQGRDAVFFSKIASGARRGLSFEKLRARFDPALAYAFHALGSPNQYILDDTWKQAWYIYNPEYTSINDGLEQLKAGDIVSFAPNSNVLVRPTNRAAEPFEAVFMGKNVIATYQGPELRQTLLGNPDAILPLLQKDK